MESKQAFQGRLELSLRARDRELGEWNAFFEAWKNV